MRHALLICTCLVIVALSQFPGRRAGAEVGPSDAQPSWIWYPEGNPANDAPVESVCFRRAVSLPVGTKQMSIRCLVDNRCQVYVNGKLVGEHGGWTEFGDFEGTSACRGGGNVVAVVGDNLGGPAGLWLDVRADLGDGTLLRFPSDDTWRCSKTPPTGWMLPGFDDTGWVSAAAMGPIPCLPWGDFELQQRITAGVGVSLAEHAHVRLITGNWAADDWTPYLTNKMREKGTPEPRPNGDFYATVPVQMHNEGVQDADVYVSWIGFEHEGKGILDWHFYDGTYEALKKAGLRFCVLPWVQYTPYWYQQSKDFTPLRCIEHDKDIAFLPSIWSPATADAYERYYKLLHAHFGDRIAELRLTTTGNYGEHYPCGVSPHLAPLQHDHVGFWCGDRFARADFRRFAFQRYGSLARLNTAWGTHYAHESDIVIPFPQDPSRRRQWVDFFDWYYQSVIDFAEKQIVSARKYFPNTPLRISPGGFLTQPLYGCYVPGYIKMVSRHPGVTVEYGASGGDFLEDKWKHAALKFYGVPYVPEPGSYLSPNDEVNRMFSEASSGVVTGYFDYPPNFISNWRQLRGYLKYIQPNHKPVVDVAVLCPTTEVKLPSYHRGTEVSGPGTAGYLAPTIAGCAELRNTSDFDFLDELLIRDGALRNYRVLVMFQGNTLERATLARIEEWVRAGGVLVANDLRPISSVEGDTSFQRDLLTFGKRPAEPLATTVITPIPTSMAVDVGTPGDTKWLTGIWNGPERFIPGGSTTRWTCEKSGVKLCVDPSRSYRLEIAAGIGQIRIRKSVLLDGQKIGDLDDRQRTRGVYTYNIPSSAFGGRPVANLVFETDTIIPSEVFKGSPDGRRLGIAVDWVRMTQRGATSAPIANPDIAAKIELNLREIYSRWTHRVGAGYVVFFPYGSESADEYQQLLQELIYNLTALDPHKKNAMRVDGDNDGVQATLFSDTVLYLNPTEKRIEKQVSVDGRVYRLSLPAHAIGAIARRDRTVDIPRIPAAGEASGPAQSARP